MTKVEYELMTPAEVVSARARMPVVFVPVSPLEWHGPHLPLGTDGLHANYVAAGAARIVGGVVLPPLFIGSETVRKPGTGAEELGALGLDGDARVVGMDFPANSVKSLYYEESAFGIAVREVVRGLKADFFRLIILVNGHGAVNHMRTLERIAREETIAPDVVVASIAVWLRPAPPQRDPGHADRGETAVMLAIAPQHVRLGDLPPLEIPLAYPDYGIVDGDAFDGNPSPDFLLPDESDPRHATRDEGLAIVEREIETMAEAVRAELARLRLDSPAATTSEFGAPAPLRRQQPT